MRRRLGEAVSSGDRSAGDISGSVQLASSTGVRGVGRRLGVCRGRCGVWAIPGASGGAEAMGRRRDAEGDRG